MKISWNLECEHPVLRNESLVEARLAKGYTQRDMAQKLACAVIIYQKYENMCIAPNRMRRTKIAEILETTPNELFNRNEIVAERVKLEKYCEENGRISRFTATRAYNNASTKRARNMKKEANRKAKAEREARFNNIKSIDDMTIKEYRIFQKWQNGLKHQDIIKEEKISVKTFAKIRQYGTHIQAQKLQKLVEEIEKKVLKGEKLTRQERKILSMAD